MDLSVGLRQVAIYATVETRCLGDELVKLQQWKYGQIFGQIFEGYLKVAIVDDGAIFGQIRGCRGFTGIIYRRGRRGVVFRETIWHSYDRDLEVIEKSCGYFVSFFLNKEHRCYGII